MKRFLHHPRTLAVIFWIVAGALTVKVWLPLMAYGFGAWTAVICFAAATLLAIVGLKLWEAK